MPFASLAFGFGVFAAIGLPGLANFAGEIMIFFGAFNNGWRSPLSHLPDRDGASALGSRYSTVYMLRAYRKTFMGALSDRRKEIVDVRFNLRLPIASWLARSFVMILPIVCANGNTSIPHLFGS